MALQKARKENTATGFKFLQAGDSIKGYYQGQVSKTINGAPAIEHTYKTSDGVLSVLGQANILNQIKNNGITPGTYVEVVFSGQMQRLKSGRTMKVYDVSYDLDDRDDNFTAPVNNSTEEDSGEYTDEVQAEAPRAPVAAAKIPSPDGMAKMREILHKTRTKSA